LDKVFRHERLGHLACVTKLWGTHKYIVQRVVDYFKALYTIAGYETNRYKELQDSIIGEIRLQRTQLSRLLNLKWAHVMENSLWFVLPI
jgi:hypothetical protein